jgi:glycosyltransferase involved in cell wall biosynthesis
VKKVCVVTPEFPPTQWGGLAKTAHKVAGNLKGLGLDVHVAHFSVAPHPFVLLDENRSTERFDDIVVHRITVGRELVADSNRELWDCPHNLTLQMIYQSLEMLVRDQQYDLFVSFFLYPVGYVTGLIAKRFDIPSIAVIVGNDIKKYIFSPEKAAVCRSGLENADIIVSLSADLMEMGDALVPIRHKTRIIYNSVQVPKQYWKRSRGPVFRVGCAGIFKYAKGLPYLFKAVGSLSRRHQVSLELVGQIRPSESEMIARMTDASGIGGRLTIKEPMPRDLMPDWLSTLDAFVLPSVTEGCPNILMEAMAFGVPCVATRTGAAEQLTQHGAAGLLVPWGNSRAIEEALNELISDYNLAVKLGAAARQAMSEFSEDRERIEWEKSLQELVEL